MQRTSMLGRERSLRSERMKHMPLCYAQFGRTLTDRLLEMFGTVLAGDRSFGTCIRQCRSVVDCI